MENTRTVTQCGVSAGIVPSELVADKIANQCVADKIIAAPQNRVYASARFQVVSAVPPQVKNFKRVLAPNQKPRDHHRRFALQ